MLPLEGNCWILTLGGRHADKPPGDGDRFLAYAQQLRTPTIYNTVKRAQRVSEVARFGFPASVWRHFEQIEPFPRVAADRRRDLPLQSRVWPGHERGCAGGGLAPPAPSQAGGRTRPSGRARAGFLCWRVGADRYALGGGRCARLFIPPRQK